MSAWAGVAVLTLVLLTVFGWFPRQELDSKLVSPNHAQQFPLLQCEALLPP